MSGTRREPLPFKHSGKVPNIGTLYVAELFKGIESTELELFFGDVELQTCPAGTMVFMPEDSTERLYILKQGRVDLFLVTASGKRLVTRQILPGSAFGIMGLLGQAMQGSFAEATEDSTICMITQEDVLALLRRWPGIALRLLEIVGDRLRLLEDRFLEITYSPVSVRLAHFLLINADSASGMLSDLTHEEIGNMIGAVRQTVTETLSVMRHQGLILTEPKQIRIIDRQGIEEIARGSGR